MKKICYTFILSVFLLLINGCNDEPEDGGLSTIDLNSYIQVYDKESLLTDPEGARITLFSPDSLYSGLYDAEGHVLLKNIESGTYNIKYSKPGYSTQMRYGVRVIGGPAEGIVSGANLYELPTEIISNLNINFYQFYCQVSGELADLNGERMAVRLFISLTPEVSSTNFFTTTTMAIESSDMTDGTHFSFVEYDLASFLVNYIGVGDTVYIKAYVTHLRDLNVLMYYYDEVNDVYVFNTLGPEGSNTVEVTIL
jgi:hypothetical protein